MKNGGLAHPFSPHRLAFFCKNISLSVFSLDKAFAACYNFTTLWVCKGFDGDFEVR